MPKATAESVDTIPKRDRTTPVGGSIEVGAGGEAAGGAPAEGKKPEDFGPFNILFILADDYGVMDVGAYNPDTFYETPALDRLAQEGMRFTQGYAANPVCSPTRFSILTGKYPTRGAATNYFGGTRSATFEPAPMNHFMALEEVTLAEALKSNGYRTGFLGKWHLGPARGCVQTCEPNRPPDESFWPEHQGFDENIGGVDRGSPRGGFFSPYENPRLTDGPVGEHLPERLTTEALAMMDRFKDDKFLIYMSYYSVHNPMQGKEELVAKYELKKQSLPPGASFATEEQVWPGEGERQVRIKQEHATYAAMIESMDTNIGRLLDGLEERGLTEKTVVVFMSDNGGLSTSEGTPTSNLPFRGGKGWLYEGGVREPYMIKVPGVTEPGAVSATPVISMDFYPTIMALTHTAPLPAQHQDGVNLWPLLSGAGDLEPRDLFWHYPHYPNQGGFPGGAIRVGNLKLLERYEDGQVNLYHLDADEGELNDLAEVMPDKVTEMREKLHAWYKQVDAKFLQPKGGATPWKPGQ